MSYRKKLGIILTIETLMFIGSFVIVYPDIIGFCPVGDMSCVYNFPVFSIGEPLLISTLFLIFVSTLLLFFKEQIFNFWKKFARIYIPIAVILTIISPTTSGGFVDFDKELTAWWLSGLFLIISIGIIIWQSIILRKKD